MLCVFSKLLHLVNPNLRLLNRGGGGGVDLCGPGGITIIQYIIDKNINYNII